MKQENNIRQEKSIKQERLHNLCATKTLIGAICTFGVVQTWENTGNFKLFWFLIFFCIFAIGGINLYKQSINK